MDSTKAEYVIFDLKLQKAKGKSYSTKVKNKRLNAVSDVEELNKKEIRDLQTLFDQVQDNVSSVFENFVLHTMK